MIKVGDKLRWKDSNAPWPVMTEAGAKLAEEWLASHPGCLVRDDGTPIGTFEQRVASHELVAELLDLVDHVRAHGVESFQVERKNFHESRGPLWHYAYEGARVIGRRRVVRATIGGPFHGATIDLVFQEGAQQDFPPPFRW